MFGLPPFEGGDIRLRSLNYVNANIADEYQLTKASAITRMSTEQDNELDVSGKQELVNETLDQVEGNDNESGNPAFIASAH